MGFGQRLYACFSLDGQRVASASTDDTVRLWNLRGEKLAVFRGHQGMVWQLAFTPDGARLVSGSFDRTARVWLLRTDDLIELARRLVPRELSPSERQRYAYLGVR